MLMMNVLEAVDQCWWYIYYLRGGLFGLHIDGKLDQGQIGEKLQSYHHDCVIGTLNTKNCQ